MNITQQKSMKTFLVTYDWKEQPDWDEINRALSRMDNPRIYPIDTQSDEYAILIAPSGLTRQRAQKIGFDLYSNGETQS